MMQHVAQITRSGSVFSERDALMVAAIMCGYRRVDVAPAETDDLLALNADKTHVIRLLKRAISGS